MVAQCLGAICGCALVKSFQKGLYNRYGGGANSLADGYSTGTGLGAEIIGTFVLVYTVFSATDPKRSARDSHVPVSFKPKFSFHEDNQLHVVMMLFGFEIKGSSSTANWVCCVYGSSSHHSGYRHRY